MPRLNPIETDHAATRCRAMLAALVIHAVRDLTRAPASGEPPDLRRQALRWIFDEDRRDPGSFVWACSHLNIDPGFAREAIRQRERDVATVAALPHAPVDPERTVASARILAWRKQVASHAVHV